MDPLVWSIILLVVGLLLVMLEVFVPSGGVLGFLSVVVGAGGDRHRVLQPRPRSRE